MIEVFTVVLTSAKGLESKFITPSDWDLRRGDMRTVEWNKRTRSYSKIGQAKTYRNRLEKSRSPDVEGIYRIAFLRINDDGSLECGWADE